MKPRNSPRQSSRVEISPKGKQFLEKAAYVVAPGTTVFGLLYYFGSTYQSSYYAYFGIHVNELELSPQDRVIGSPTAIFLPLFVLVLLGLSGLALFMLIDRKLSGRRLDELRHRISWGLAGAGIGLLLLGFPLFLQAHWWRQGVLLRLAPGWPRELLPPLIPALGALLVMFALYLRRGSGRRKERIRAVSNGLLIALVAMVLFFDMARYANLAGIAAASREAARGFGRMSHVLVHANKPITYTEGYTGCKDFGAEREPYRFTCDGFRIIAKSKTQYYLVPDRPRRMATLVLRDDDSIRVEVWGPS